MLTKKFILFSSKIRSATLQTMTFQNRQAAGQSLSEALSEYSHCSDTVVVALARGGVVLGVEVASALDLPLQVTCPRKIPHPENEELAIGATTEEGLVIWLEEWQGVYPSRPLQDAVKKQTELAKRRKELYQKKLPPISLENQRVILVDDGIATGATMLAAIDSTKQQKAKEVIVAIPVAPRHTAAELTPFIDRFIALHTPTRFYAVGQFYEEFPQVTDKEIEALLDAKMTPKPKAH